MHADEPDAALIDASRNGDCAAFAQIVERYQRAVYAVSYSNVRDRALSDDITQDTFVTAWRRLADLRDSAKLPAWLCGIARNHARDARKRLRREHASEADELVDLATPFDALSTAQSERLIAVALAEVPEAYREPLVLFYYEHRSIEDVARVLGISTHTTNKRLSRGRQHLAARVEALVERQLGARGPKRDLAACVVAVIAVLGPAKQVDASTKGSVMPKLALVSVVLATAGGAGLLLANPTTRAPSPASHPTASAPADTRGRDAAPARRAIPTSNAASSRATVAPSLPPAPPSPRVVPDCESVGRHMAELKIDTLDEIKKLPAAKRAKFVALRASDVARRCTSQQWPEERRICILAADDSESARVDCVEGLVATPADLAAMPPELRCDLVAKHIAVLVSAPDGKFGMIAKQSGGKFDLQQVTGQMREAQAAECDRIPWSLAVRRCIVASQTNRDMTSCM